MQIANEEEPVAPKNNEENENIAKLALSNYTVAFWHKWFGIESRIRNRLAAALVNAKNQDNKISTEKQRDFQKQKQDWTERKAIADNIVDNEKVMADTLEKYLQIGDLTIGRNVSFDVSDNKEIDVNLQILPYEKVIPEEEYGLRQSGMLSTKKMPKGKGMELYQDHVCSAMIRLAREIFGILPVESLRINALLEAVDSQTGHLEYQVVVSAILVRDTLNTLNLNRLDPSDSLRNFVHTMKFKKIKGFEKVEKAELDSV